MKTATLLAVIGISVLMFAIGLVTATSQTTSADFKTSQADFVADCNDDGAVSVASGTQLEVFNFFPPAQGLITRDCEVTLAGEDSELNLAERTNLLFRDSTNAGAYHDFDIAAAGAGFEIEVQVKKNSRIEAQNLTVDISGAEEAEAQFEENFCLRLHGNLTLAMSTGTDEGGDVQFKKFIAETDTQCVGSPNIDVDGDITLSVSGGDSEIQIEESNHLVAGGDISMSGGGVKSQVQTKKDVTLDAGGNITLSAADDESEVQAEENNTFTAAGAILLVVGDNGKLEVKKESIFTAGGSIDIILGTDTTCKIEGGIGAWSAVGGITTTGCLITP